MACKNHPLIEDRLTRCSRCAEAFCPDCIVEIGGLPYCQLCKDASLRDLRAGVVVRDLDMASLGRRLVAIGIDGLIIALPSLLLVVLVAIPMGFLDVEAEPFAIMTNLFVSLFLGALSVLYEGLMLSSGGQTVGKKALRIKVVTAEGGEISRGHAWGRAVSRQILSIVPCLGLVDYLVAFGEERTCIHDMMAKTRVVNWE